jgi:hypothetical protein
MIVNIIVVGQASYLCSFSFLSSVISCLSHRGVFPQSWIRPKKNDKLNLP